jgi:hypothetical protein
MSLDQIKVSYRPTAEKEANQLESVAELQKEEYRDRNKAKRDFAQSTECLGQTWVGFLIVLTIAQFICKGDGLGLDRYEFLGVVVTSTATILGLWWQVGKSLYPSNDKVDPGRAPKKADQPAA